MDEKVPLDPLHELAAWFTMMWEQHIRVFQNELFAELSMINARNFRDFGWILLHLSPPSGEVFLESRTSSPNGCQRREGELLSCWVRPEQ